MDKVLYFGGPILTMDRESPRVEAVLVSQGKIQMTGKLSDVSAAAGACQVVNLEGKTLMPGFVDGHSHMASVGLMFHKCDLTGSTSFEELLQRIRDFRKAHNLTHGEMISCRGYDPALMAEGAHPTAALLDSLGFDNPIACTHQSGHMSVYNTAAMKLCGVDDSFISPPGGREGRDAEGHLTGYFEEKAQGALSAVFNRFSEEAYLSAILEAQDYYFSQGFTTIQEGGGTGEERLLCFEKLARNGKLRADVVVYLAPRPADETYWARTIHRLGNRAYWNHLKIGGIKLLLDGSPQARTAWMRQPYEGTPDYSGYGTMKDATLLSILRNAVAADLQPIAHCNGDAAAEQFIQGWKKTLAETGQGRNLRPVMVHAQTVGYDQLDEMACCSMMPSFFVGHCWFWGDTHLKNFGERGQRISPIRSAMERGLPFNLHQDSPVTPPNMLHSVWCAVNRITRKGVSIGSWEKIDVYDALIGATRGGAYSYFEENSKGALFPGMVADMIILDADPTAIDPMKIRDIRVLETIKDGKTVYRAK